MTNISPTGGIVPLAIAQPPAAQNDNKAPADTRRESVVPPISKADQARADLPEDRSAEARLQALAAQNRPSSNIASRVADALSGSGMHVVDDGSGAPVTGTGSGDKVPLQVAVPDSIPDKIPY